MESDGVEERGSDLFIADMRGRTRGSTCVFVVALSDAFFVFGAGMPGFRLKRPGFSSASFTALC